MKKLLCLILALSALLCLASCSSGESDDVSHSPAESAPDLESVQVGDYITFGAYEQDNNTSNGKEAIEWLVLDIQDGRALVISKYGLDCKPYNSEYESVTWKTCTLRTWLNEDFLYSAFSASEIDRIPTVTVSADVPVFDTDPGNDTYDKVFLLSMAEANKYFSSDSERECKATAYAIEQGAWINDYSGYEGNCCWWLRSPGSFQDYAAFVSFDCGVNNFGLNVDNRFLAVRPALWINVESSEASKPSESDDVSHSPAESAPDLESVQVGDYITFGAYEQDNDTSNGKEAIEWLVLDIQDGKALIISKYALDCQPYNTEWEDVTWETCTLRTWLNNSFLNSAFSSSEIARIPTVTVSADAPVYDTDPGNDTYDKIFLLSIVEAEANKHFDSDEERECKATAYAIEQGAYTYEGSCCWWLRSPGYDQSSAAGVSSGGYNYYGGFVYSSGYRVHNSNDAVRPAMWIELDS